MSAKVDWSTTAIVGVGLMGGSLALALKSAGLARHVVGISRPETVESAIRLGVIDDGGGYDELEALVRPARVVFLCTPIGRIVELLPRVASAAEPGTLVSDVGARRGRGAVDGRVARPGVDFIGGHPMAGSEQSGVAAADPFLYQNAMYALTPLASTDDDLVQSFASGLGALGARVIRLSPDTHDRVAAAISHLPQLLALALTELVADRNDVEPAHLQMAAGGFRDMTRIASSPYGMWEDILATNAGPVREAIGEFRELLATIERDLDDMGGHFERANATRAAIPEDAKGFLSPLCDVLVRCNDEPGVLAAISGGLAAHDVNIMDIELLKVREGEGGTFRMAFRDEATAERAIVLLNEAGFRSRRR